MGAAENKEVVRKLREAKGVDAMFAMMADDVRWTIMGTTKYSHTMSGKQEILDKLLKPITAELESMGTSIDDNIIAEGDFVVLQRARNRPPNQDWQALQQPVLPRLQSDRRKDQGNHRISRHRIGHLGFRPLGSPSTENLLVRDRMQVPRIPYNRFQVRFNR